MPGKREACPPPVQLDDLVADPRKGSAEGRYALNDMERLVWTPREVVDVDGPRAMLRAYLEQRDVREFCASVSLTTRIEAACDVGCGFGRLRSHRDKTREGPPPVHAMDRAAPTRPCGLPVQKELLRVVFAKT